jgi:hypothetical protein
VRLLRRRLACRPSPRDLVWLGQAGSALRPTFPAQT